MTKEEKVIDLPETPEATPEADAPMPPQQPQQEIILHATDGVIRRSRLITELAFMEATKDENIQAMMQRATLRIAELLETYAHIERQAVNDDPK